MEMMDLFQIAEERKASDILLTVGVPPVLRVDKRIVQTNLERLSVDSIKQLIYSLLKDEHIHVLESERELNFSYSASGIARFRANIFFQRNILAAAFRRIPFEIPSLEELGLPVEILKKLSRLKSGLVIVSGPVGSGKTTTLAAMVELINTEQEEHIIAIEDPIEFLFKHKKSIVEQREIPSDTRSFGAALKNIMRQNPDVILVGEIRDTETVRAAITAAETGALVLTTLHAPNASEVINRIIDFFSPEHQRQIRIQLASTLAGVVSQALIPSLSEKGLVLACEILICQPNIKTLIREGKVHQILNVMETSSRQGMQSMDQILISLYRQKRISSDDLMYYIFDPRRDEVKAILNEDIF